LDGSLKSQRRIAFLPRLRAAYDGGMSEQPKSRRTVILLLAIAVLAVLVWMALFMPAYHVPHPYHLHQQ